MWRTSFFSPSLFASNMRRFWPLAVAVLVVSIIPGLVLAGSGGYPSDVVDSAAGVANMTNHAMPAPIATGAIVAALLVFGYLHKRTSVSFFHGLPVSRVGQFATGWVSCFVLGFVPMAAGLAIDAMLAGLVGAGSEAPAILGLIGFGAVALVLFVSLAALSCVVCGNALGSALVYLALNFAAMVIALGFGALVSALMPGIGNLELLQGPLEFLTPVVNLRAAIAAETGGAAAILGVYLVAGVVIALLAGWLYSIRRDETAGETVSFKPVRIVCMVLFALVFSCLGTNFVCLASSLALGSAGSLLALHLVFAAIGWFVASMIVNRSLRVFGRRSLAGCAVLLAAVLVCAGLMRADAFGITTQVPDPSRVEQATVGFDGSSVDVEADDAIAIHRAILDNRDLLGDGAESFFGNGWGGSITVAYYLSDGDMLYRRYQLPWDFWSDYLEGQSNPITDEMNRVLAKPESLHQLWFNMPADAVDESSVIEAAVEIYGAEGEQAGVIDEEAPVEEHTYDVVKDGYGLYKAVAADIEGYEGKPLDIVGGIESYGNIQFSFLDKNAPRDTGDGPAHATTWSQVDINPGMDHTIAWLESYYGRKIM